jgi:hypothetical protein
MDRALCADQYIGKGISAAGVTGWCLILRGLEASAPPSGGLSTAVGETTVWSRKTANQRAEVGELPRAACNVAAPTSPPISVRPSPPARPWAQ